MSAGDLQPPLAAGRRHLLFAGVAGLAGLAGAGLAWWKWRPDSTSEDAAAALWPLEFTTPAGSTLAMMTLRGKPLLVNFWATWCPPCIEELPLLDQFYRENAAKSWQVVGLAIDQPGAVRAFLQRTPVSFPVGLAGLGGTELSKALGNLAGALPYTVVISGSGEVVQRRMGRVTAAELTRWAKLR
jgi:thiol-disulfide isomerase/thioredoxin